MTAQVQKPAPTFSTQAVVNGAFQMINLEDYKGKYVILFFYPLDFTFVCPTELIAFSDRIKEFEERNAVVLGVSTDSRFSHLAWINTPRKEGGLGGLNYPLCEDLSHNISRSYGMLLDAGIALRGLFLLDKEGIIRHITVNDLPLGRSIDEALRMLDALQHFEKQGEVCPANWKPGKEAINPKEAKKFFAQM